MTGFKNLVIPKLVLNLFQYEVKNLVISFKLFRTILNFYLFVLSGKVTDGLGVCWLTWCVPKQDINCLTWKTLVNINSIRTSMRLRPLQGTIILKWKLSSVPLFEFFQQALKYPIPFTIWNMDILYLKGVENIFQYLFIARFVYFNYFVHST